MRRTTKTAKQGLKEGWSRASFIIRDEYLAKIDALAYRKNRQKKDILDEALAQYFKGKKIKPLQII